MADVRVERTASARYPRVDSSRDRGARNAPDHERGRHEPEPDQAPAEELAVALGEANIEAHGALSARLEQGDDGVLRARIVGADGSTVAFLELDELQTLAGRGALPPGLLLRVRT